MEPSPAKDEFLALVKQSFEEASFVRLNFGKSKSESLVKIAAKEIELKQEKLISFQYKYSTNDQVKNYSFSEALGEAEKMIGETFFHIALYTTTQEVELKYNKKYKAKLYVRNNTTVEKPSTSHDKEKQRLITDTASNVYLKQLNVVNEQGQLLKAKGDKYKQICKYVEIMDGLFQRAFGENHKDTIKIADMGSGSGYLTFALADYFLNFCKQNAEITGLELREELVEKCNTIVEKCAYSNLNFSSGLIQDYNVPVDVLIALHACDTATDDAISKGIKSEANLIVCAPCCHKQIRKQLDSKAFVPDLLKHGIYQERFSEMLTDSMRALILEAFGYKVQIFEFIGSEHAGKNSMITAVKQKFIKKPDFSKVDFLMKSFDIKEFALLAETK